MFLIGDMLRRNARLYHRKTAIIQDQQRFSYAEVNARCNQLANGLLSLGFKKGDKIGFMGNNCHEFVEYYFAVAKCGMIAVPVNARFSASEAAYVVSHSETTGLICTGDVEGTVAQMRPSTPLLRHIISTGAGFPSYEELLDRSSDEEPPGDVAPDDVALIMYTSGATGLPKGVITTFRNIMANTNTMVLELRLVHEDITVLAMPLFHNGGLWPTMAHVHRGATIVLMPKFDVESMLEVIEKEKVTFVNLVPTMLLRIVTNPDFAKYNIDSIRLIMYAGAPIPMEQLKKALKVIGPHRFYNSLGCTEASGNLLSFPATDHALEGPMASKLGSVGKDAMGVEIRIVDDQGKDVPSGVAGEIIGRGDNIALGYWKLPEETAEVFKDGWLHTGDVGYRDEDGYVFIVDRKKDMIITGGENVASREVEEVLHQHPAIREAAVFGVPDEEWGEAVTAVVAFNPEAGVVSAAELIEFCKARLAGYKKPRSIDVVDELPKNAAGKIDKATLKRFYREKYEKERAGVA